MAGKRPTTGEQVRDMVRAGDVRRAILTASRFQNLGPQKARIHKAREAYLRPDFQRELGHDPDALIADGILALKERYGE